MKKFEDNRHLIIDLKKLLAEAGLSQKNVADALGIKPQSLNTMLNKKHFSFRDCQKILGAIGYELEYTFSKKEE
ncbi:MAG TPA: XRE family transcriptional regulator [Lachnospiraceae bacterium]|nr:XRE family transcriptional regulator [Lachnospiraceae bacterium]